MSHFLFKKSEKPARISANQLSSTKLDRVSGGHTGTMYQCELTNGADYCAGMRDDD